MLRLAVALWPFWHARGYLNEGRRWLEAGLAQSVALPPLLRANTLNAVGVLAYTQGAYTASVRSFVDCLALRRELHEQAGIAAILSNLGMVVRYTGESGRALELQEESLTLFRAIDDKRGIAKTLNNLGTVLVDQEGYTRAKEVYNESLTLRRELGDRRGAAICLMNL